MEQMQSDRDEQNAEQEIEIESSLQPRRGDRRDGDALFAYQGPERRSGRDRRASA